MLGKTPTSKQFTTTWVVQRVVGPGSGSLPGTGGSAGAEIGADVGCMGRAFLCLALRELEEGPGPSQPTLESWGGVFEAVIKNIVTATVRSNALSRHLNQEQNA
jgi:hypothetical protein